MTWEGNSDAICNSLRWGRRGMIGRRYGDSGWGLFSLRLDHGNAGSRFFRRLLGRGRPIEADEANCRPAKHYRCDK